MGIAGILARTFTGIFIGLFFVSRTDRNLMIQGFHNSDRGYASYVGYLHVVAMHRNPVRVVFCQILLDLFYKQHVIVKKGKIFSCDLSLFLHNPNWKSLDKWSFFLQLLKT
jgi:hypothetical protein